MFKVKVTENFTLKDYESIKDIEMNGEKCDIEITEKGAKFSPNMTFVCNADMLEYLMGGNRLKKKFVEVVSEVIEAEEIKVENVEEIAQETVELKEVQKKRKSNKKKK